MATDLETSVAELIVNTNIVSDVINEGATTEVVTSNGPIPSIRKALADNVYFQDPVPWSNGTNETEFNQLRTFTDGTVWWSPSATTVNPVPMGVTPAGDSNWYPFQDRNLKNNILEEVTRFNIKGTFAAGFIYETVDDVGLDNSGNPWTYTGSLPFTVAAGTVPTSPTYNEEGFSDHSSLSGRNSEGAHNAAAIANSNGGTVQEFIDRNSPFAFGAVGDGVTDDSTALFNYWKNCLSNGTPFDISGGYEFLITGINYTDGSVRAYYQTEENDNVTVISGTSKIKIVPPAGQGRVNLFDIKQTNGFRFDIINYEVDATRAAAGDNVRAGIIRHGTTRGSSDIKGYIVKAVNGEGFLATTDIPDYTANGFDSVFRSRDIHILSVNVDNTAMPFTFANEFTGYGITCQLSGDNCVIERLVVNNIHRAVFAYGVRGLRVNGGEVTESNATTVNLGPFGSVVDCKIKLKLIQNTNLATDLVRIRPNELGTANGGSLDIQGNRAHHMKDIVLDLVETGDATSIDSGLNANKTTGNGADSVFNFKNIRIKLVSEYENISRGMTIFDQAKGQNSTNMVVDGFTIEDTTCNSNCRISLLENMAGNIDVRNSHFTKSVICEYGSLADTTPNEDNWIVFDNTIIGFTVSENGDYDTPVQFINGSRVATVVNSANAVPAQNKIFRDSYIADKFFSYKPRYGVYTNVNNSSAMFNPDNPVSNLIGGASSIGSAATPKTVDLVAASNLSTNSDAEIYHEYFFGNSIFGRTTNNRVEIYVRAVGSSNWAVAHGFLISEGLGSDKDFTSETFALSINNVANVGSGGYVDSDFSLTVVDANTLRFSCSRASQDIAVSIYDN